jgi:MFS family permease
MRPGSVTHVVRRGRFAGLHLEELGLQLLVDLIDDIGYGTFQMMALILAGGVVVVDACMVGSVMPVNAQIARDFGLASDTKAILPALVYSGSALGMLCSGFLGDEYGRRWPIIFSYLGVGVSQTILACSTSPAGIFICRFLGGIAAGAGIPCAFTLLAELSPGRNRRGVVFALAALAILGHTIMDIFGRFSINHFGWRGHVFSMTIPAWLLFGATFSFLRDSPSYYAVQGDLLGLEAVLEYMARRNSQPRLGGSPYFSTRGRSGIVASCASQPTLGVQKVQGSQRLTLLVRSYPTVVASVGLVALSKGFLGHGMSYIWPRILLTFSFESLSPMLLYMSAVTCQFLGLTVGYLLSSQCTQYRSPCIFFMLTAMVSAATLVPSMSHGYTSLLMPILAAAKFALEPLGAILCIFKAEVFPTQVRATAFGLLSFCGWLGVTFVPIVAEVLATSGLKEGEISADFLCAMGVAGALGVVGALSLPHCRQGRPLEDFVGQGEASRKFKHPSAARAYFYNPKPNDEIGPLLSEEKFPYGNNLRMKSSYEICRDRKEIICDNSALSHLGTRLDGSCGNTSWDESSCDENEHYPIVLASKTDEL